MNKTKTKHAQSTSIRTPKETLMNTQRREKLKQILIQKMKKNFGGFANEKIIEDEVAAFLRRDQVNENDLKQLELSIQKKLTKKTEVDNLKNNLSSQPRDLGNENTKNQVSLPDINKGETGSVRSHHSRMSGASNLDKFDEKGAVDRLHEEEMRDFESMNKKKEPVKKLDFSQAKNEWDAINMYNKKMFEQEKLISLQKDKEIQRRTKEDLDSQVKQKLKRLYEEKLKAQEYDVILLKHLDKLKELEEKRKLEVKKRMLKEKDNRDAQMKDEQIHKRIEVLKNKKYERQLVNHLKEEIEREKKIAIEKKIAEKEALQKTLKDNEIHKLKLIEERKKEREDDIKIMEDAAKVKEKQENERIEYFKRIERNSNSFMSKMVDTVLKKQEEKNDEEEENLRQYNLFKNQQEDELEEKKKQQIRDNKKMIREFLDKQCQEKQLEKEYEHQIDAMQGRIWKQDTKNYYEHEKEVAAIIKKLNKNNLAQLNSQVTAKRSSMIEMSDVERAMNRKLLEQASEAV